MSNTYTHYNPVTREALDTIKAGDLVKVNDWKRPMRVKGVSENYFVMTQPVGKRTMYSVVSKKPWGGIRHNAMVGGMFHCGPDNLIFGSSIAFEHHDLYYFNDAEMTAEYLQQFEDGDISISERRGMAIYDLYVKEGR